MAMPLTWQLNNETPLRRWFAARLHRIDDVPDGPPVGLRPVVPRRRPDVLPPWLIGMAFDWRLRIGIDVPADPFLTSAYAGWCQLRDALGERSGRALAGLAAESHGSTPEDPVAQLFQVAVEAGAGGADDRDEVQLARISVALARYEACYRGGVRRDDQLVTLGATPSVEALLALCPGSAADELVRLTAAARRGLAPLFPARSVELNPDFTAYSTPADGDLLIDGLLLDLKTVTYVRLELEWLWQVLANVFLDGGERRIESVGLYFSWHAWLGTWRVDRLLTALAGTVVTRSELREEFCSVVGGAP